jgi:hypothetical protein
MESKSTGRQGESSKALIALALGVCVALLVYYLPRKSKSASRATPGDTVTVEGRSRTGRPAGNQVAGTASASPRLIGVPKLIGPPEPRLQNDPTAPDYDIGKLRDVAQLSTENIYQVEPRDPKWAKTMEEFITEIAVKDQETGKTGGRLRSIDCRMATCKVILEAADQNSLTKTQRMFSISNPAQMSMLGNPEGPPGVSHSFFLGFRKEHRDLDKAKRWFAGVRQYKLKLLREKHGGRPPRADEPILPDK